MDLLTVLAHQLGQVLDHDHEEDGVMAETLPAGTRHMPGISAHADDRIALGLDLETEHSSLPLVAPPLSGLLLALIATDRSPGKRNG